MTEYQPTPDEVARIEKAFSFHPAKADQPARYQLVRECAAGLSALLLVVCPPSRERALALTHIEDAVLWAIAAIARNEI